MNTVSLEVAKKLKEAGFFKRSKFTWIVPEVNGVKGKPYVVYQTEYIPINCEIYFAPTLGELIREPALRDCKFFWETIGTEKLFWVEPPGANCIEDLYSEDTPEDAAGLALEALKGEKGD